MKVLLTHQNFPGQYLHLARYLGQAGHDVVFVTQRGDKSALDGVKKVVYKPKRRPTKNMHHYLVETEGAVLNAQEVTRVALDLRAAGFIPDVMLGHNGWGETWYLKDVFPKSPLIGYFEFFYRHDGADVGFDANEAAVFDRAPRVRTKNLGNLLGLDAADLGQCATHWQKSLYPERYHSMLHVVHEGVDTAAVKPDPNAHLVIADQGIDVRTGDEVVTYVARNLEPYRGFPSFMRALPAVLRTRPNARVLIVGGDEVSYGARLDGGRTYRELMLEELGDQLDLSRVHFLGKIPYPTFLKVLQVSSVHVYLTYPFVLSWSMLEAMAAGCLIVGSKTEPVQEVIRDGDNGILVDFFSHAQIAEWIVEALRNRRDFEQVRSRARLTVEERYDLRRVCLPAQLKLLDQALGTSAG